MPLQCDKNEQMKILTKSEKKILFNKREKVIIESFVNTFNSIKRLDENDLVKYSDDAEEIPDSSSNLPDVQSSLIYKIVVKIDTLLKDDIHVEPNEYGHRVSYMMNLFSMMFEAVFNNDYSKLIGFKKGDVRLFINRIKKWLSNHDIISLTNGTIDVEGSNFQEVAKLILELEKL